MGAPESTRLSSRMNVADVVGGGLIILVGAFFFINALEFGVFGAGGRLAPGAMPFFSGVFLSLCGLGIAVNGLLKPGAAEGEVPAQGSEPADASTDAEVDASAATDADIDDTSEEMIGSEANERVGKSLIVLAAATAATWFASRIGFLLAFALMVFGLLTVLERERMWRAAIVAVGTFAFAWFVFDFFLNIPLPETISF